MIFAKNLGICVKGYIILSHDVVSDCWTNVRLVLISFLLLIILLNIECADDDLFKSSTF